MQCGSYAEGKRVQIYFGADVQLTSFPALTALTVEGFCIQGELESQTLHELDLCAVPKWPPGLTEATEAPACSISFGKLPSLSQIRLSCHGEVIILPKGSDSSDYSDIETVLLAWRTTGTWYYNNSCKTSSVLGMLLVLSKHVKSPKPPKIRWKAFSTGADLMYLYIYGAKLKWWWIRRLSPTTH